MGEVDPRAFGGLERDVKHLTDQIAALDKRIDELETAIGNLTGLLNKMRGGVAVFAALIAAPSFIAGLVTALKVFR